jgi:hypothetical protein
MMDEPRETQTPSGDGIFLDHVGWFVPDMDAAAAAFARLGFPMSPYTVHTNEAPDGTRVPSGTANRCAMLKRGYLEVLTAVEGVDTPLSRQLRGGIARYTGLHLIALTVADADAATERLRAAGFAPQPPVALRRAMPLDAGGEGTAEFSVIRLPADAMAEGRIQILTQDAPDIVWQPSVTASENALDMLSGILVCCADPDEATARYARFAGRAAVEGSDGIRRIALDRGTVAICGPEGCRSALPGIGIPDLPFMAAVAIRSADLAATRAFLAARGVALLAHEAGRIVVDPREMAGAALVVHDGGRDPFAAP